MQKFPSEFKWFTVMIFLFCQIYVLIFQDTFEEDNSIIVDKILGSRMRKVDKDVSNFYDLNIFFIIMYIDAVMVVFNCYVPLLCHHL